VENCYSEKLSYQPEVKQLVKGRTRTGSWFICSISFREKDQWSWPGTRNPLEINLWQQRGVVQPPQQRTESEKRGGRKETGWVLGKTGCWWSRCDTWGPHFWASHLPLILYVFTTEPPVKPSLVPFFLDLILIEKKDMVRNVGEITSLFRH